MNRVIIAIGFSLIFVGVSTSSMAKPGFVEPSLRVPALFTLVIEEKATPRRYGYGFDLVQNLEKGREFETVVPFNFLSVINSSLAEKGFGLSLLFSRIRVKTEDFKTLEESNVQADEFPDNAIIVSQTHLVFQYRLFERDTRKVSFNTGEINIGYGNIHIDSVGRTFTKSNGEEVGEIEVSGPLFVMKSGFAEKRDGKTLFEMNAVYMLSKGDNADFGVENTYLAYEFKVGF